jgi:hypothetical protein
MKYQIVEVLVLLLDSLGLLLLVFELLGELPRIVLLLPLLELDGVDFGADLSQLFFETLYV